MDKVLIVDDEPRLLELLTKTLKDYQNRFEVITAIGAEEAIKILEKTPVSLMVTDIVMPHMDGLELLAYVSDNYPSLPCFVMTAYKTSEILDQLPGSGDIVFRFFQKPFRVDDLAREIIEVLEKKEAVGVYKSVPIVTFLNLISMGKKSCLVEVSFANNDKATLYFNRGNLWDVVCGDLTGEAAVIALINKEKKGMKILPVTPKQALEKKGLDLNRIIKEALKNPKNKLSDK